MNVPPHALDDENKPAQILPRRLMDFDDSAVHDHQDRHGRHEACIHRRDQKKSGECPVVAVADASADPR
eukprot:CAMPEP_0185767174 /NCGR_PEP_ID=MMETSP1174-20130828/41798_1 /TAXON_ID=35687 /ORGANISM="Dictyocha speculum, Strain CCMP1381" /LENGTH=68 /DNA_ID=CAMNT_0028451243 /DNA_START=752 /DNA_END=955 /DNA_ORIENTATION=+